MCLHPTDNLSRPRHDTKPLGAIALGIPSSGSLETLILRPEASVTQSSATPLTPDQLAQFHRDGFAGPFTLYSPQQMRDSFRELRPRLMDRRSSIYTVDGKVSDLSSIANYDRHLDVPFLARHICQPGIVDRLQSILGPDILCWRSEFFPKYPGSPGTSWHQASDFSAVTASKKPQIEWTTGDHFRGALTVWTAFTESTVENGCLQLMPGTHTKMYYDESKGMGYSQGADGNSPSSGDSRAFFGYDYRDLQVESEWKPDESKALSLVMKPGEFMIFWSTLMHASHPHTSGDMRMGYTVRYLPTSARIFPYSDSLEEYGGKASLENYGAVLVSGKDEYGHNELRTETTLGHPFTTRAAPPCAAPPSRPA
ncbi:MAG: chlorinating enzyme [Deltaproteobacteria bacterium]|nr:chlorinating enzyme [Deltaproteobacteria bacterium]